jgi:hypothetical protein
MSYTHKFKQQSKQQANGRYETKVSDTSEDTDKKEYITVPYDDRTSAKMLGAKWDDEVKSWYVLPNFENYQQLIRRYPYVEKTYLYVSYEDKDKAKSMGAYYCGVNKRWYAPRPQEQQDLIKRFGSLPKVKQTQTRNVRKSLIVPLERIVPELLVPLDSPNEVEITV